MKKTLVFLILICSALVYADTSIHAINWKGNKTVDGNTITYYIDDADVFTIGEYRFNDIHDSIIVVQDGRIQKIKIKSKKAQTFEIPNPAVSISDNTYSTTDTDSDGLSDIQERIIYTDETKIDTDSDGLSDSDEVLVYGTNPVRTDELKVKDKIYSGMALIEYLKSLYQQWIEGIFNSDKLFEDMKDSEIYQDDSPVADDL